MLASKGANILRISTFLLRNQGSFKQAVRNDHHQWNYRTANTQHSKTIMYASEGIMGVAWWWILWHLCTEPEHIYGEFEYPDAAKWTDQELGIPSDEL